MVSWYSVAKWGRFEVVEGDFEGGVLVFLVDLG